MNIFAEALNSLIATYGMEECIKEADAIYSSLYKASKSLTASEIIASNPEAKDELNNTLVHMVATQLATANGTYEEPDFVNSDYDDRSAIYDMYDMAKTMIANGLTFVEVCNYKGEGEGFMIEELAVNLQTYRGKYDYY